jgi:hypothetical protein
MASVLFINRLATVLCGAPVLHGPG